MGNSCSGSGVFCATAPAPNSPSSSRHTSKSQRPSLLNRSAMEQQNDVYQSTTDPYGFMSNVGGVDGRRGSSLMIDNTDTEAVMAGALDVSENQLSTTHFSEAESVRDTISRGSWGSHRIPEENGTDSIIFVVLGGHSDRFFGKVLPALLRLYDTGLIDNKQSQFIAMGLEACSDSQFQTMCKERIAVSSSKKMEFLEKIKYIRGDCTKSDDLRKIPTNSAERTLYFFCLPDSVRHSLVMKAIGEAPNTTSWTRVVLLGSDPQTYDLSASLTVGEERIFRIDPFAGSDAVRRIISLRFGNRVLEPTWNRNHVKAVLVDFSVDSIVSSQFPSNTFLRSALIDHVLGLVALTAMERPASRFGDDVRDAKLAVLKAIQVVSADKLVLGKVAAAGEDGNFATFASIVLEIDTNRWRGVPFICRVGKHLDCTKTEVRILYRSAAGADLLWRDQTLGLRENELTIRVAPCENAVLGLISSLPGLDTQLRAHESTLDFLSQPAPYVPEPLERLIYDAMRGRRANFARKDGLEQAVRIIQPVLDAIGSSKCESYQSASVTGPASSDRLIAGHVASEHSSSPRSRHAVCPWIAEGLARDDVWQRATDFSVERELILTLRLGLDQMRLLVRAFTKEMEKGIAVRTVQTPSEKVTIRMLETYVKQLPSGAEEGVYFALDIGGTNFRVVKFELSKNGHPQKLAEVQYKIPEECKHGSAEQLFDFLAESIAKVQDPDETATYGFTFSFPVSQENISQGRLITWTKGWTTAGVVGSEITTLLEEALQRKNIKGKVAALINDTVGTLATKARENTAVRIGVILGTGTNAAFYDSTTGSVVNTEWGGFGSFGTIPELPFNKVDLEIDEDSPSPGEQWFEKMISGNYLGEIARRWLLRLWSAKELWASASIGDSAPLFTAMALDTKHLSDVELDLSDSLEGIQTIEERILGVNGSTIADRILCRLVARCVVERAARLTACAIGGVINRINIPGTVVAIDGSLFEAHASFKHRLVRALDSLGCHAPLVLSKDGSGLGAALIAAAATHSSG